MLSLLCLFFGGVNEAFAQVASIGSVKYNTLQEAFETATSGKTITILTNIDDFGAISFTGKKLTLNLNGHIVSGTSITVGKDATFTIKTNSTPDIKVDENYNVSYNSDEYGKLSLTGSVLAKDGGQVTMAGGMVESKYNIAFAVNGDINGLTPVPSKVTINHGYVKALEFCASPQGMGANVTISGNEHGVVLESLDNAVVAGHGANEVGNKRGGTTISIDGSESTPCVLIGRIKSDGYAACGVYHPQEGKLTIGNNTKIVALGGAGVVMRGGTLQLKGNTKTEIIATGDAGLNPSFTV